MTMQAGEALHSANWYRVAALTPRLRAHVRIHRHVYRDEVWYVVEDRVAGKYHRFNPVAYRVIAQMDGRRDMQSIWDRLTAAVVDDTPTQDEVVTLLGQLWSADLIQCDVTPDLAELLERGGRQRRSRTLARFANPVALRFPLLDPDALLQSLLRLAGPLAGRTSALLWLAVVLPALLLAPSHWRELTGNFNERLLAADNLLLLLVLFPLLKAVHEIGHGLVCRHFGGEVHEMGVMLLVFFPVPYVDASSASMLRGRWQRAAVGAAGMLSELFVGALAFYLWLALEPGFARSAAYNVIVLATLTTLMFNANPLLRYDGYYILADALEIPNLAQRAAQHWQYLARRHLFGQREAEAPHATPGERRWFIVYAPLALAYRTFVLFSIAVFIASRWFFIGVLVALWGLAAGLVWPLARGLKRLVDDPALGRQGPRARAVIGGAALAIALLLFVLPLPYHTVAEGVVYPPESAVLRAQGAGFVSRLARGLGQSVKAGDVVLDSVDPALSARLQGQRARLAHAQARYDAAFGIQPARAAQLADEVRREAAALATVEEEARQLVLTAGAGGRLLIARADDLPGRYLKRGEVVGYIDTASAARVRVVVPQWQVQPVTASTRVQVRLPQAPGEVWEATLLRAVPAAARELPSAALGTQGGGEIVLDPRDSRGTQALQSMFEFELELPLQMPHRQIGTRVQVRFEHEAEPVGWRAARALRRLFLSHLWL